MIIKSVNVLKAKVWVYSDTVSLLCLVNPMDSKLAAHLFLMKIILLLLLIIDPICAYKDKEWRSS